MANIEKFEDIEAWQSARWLTRLIYRHTSTGNFARDFALRDQIRRASISVLSNIAEGFERNGDKEFRQFLSTAKGSLGEVRAQLYIALDAGYLSEKDFRELYELVLETAKRVGGFMRYLGQSPLTGSKYKVQSGL